MNKSRKLTISAAVLFVAILIVSGAAFLAGSSGMGFAELKKLMLNMDYSSIGWTVFFKLRLPRIVFAIAVGAALSVAGASFQALLRNPLAEPYLLGISSGAAIGAITAIKTGMSQNKPLLIALACAGGLITVGVVYFVSRKNGVIDNFRMIMGGVVINAFLSALLLSFFALSESWDIQAILFWMMGSLGMGSPAMSVFTLMFCVSGTIVLLFFSPVLNLIMLDDESAASLGVRVEFTKTVVFLTASFLTAVCVASCGIIGFVGLIIPHLVRLVWGADNRMVIPLSALTGAIFLLSADTIARTVLSPNELPVGVITAMTGTPVFLYLMYRSRPI